MLRREPASAIDFLKRHDGTAAMLPAAERFLALQRDALALIPVAFRDVCQVASFDGGTVTLRVTSASAAAKLRQTLPRLSGGLAGRGWKVDAVRIRIQPRIAVAEAGPWPSRAVPMSAVGLAAFAALDSSLDESPLKAAVARLVARRR